VVQVEEGLEILTDEKALSDEMHCICIMLMYHGQVLIHLRHGF